jgi:hypothetical protein
MKADMAMSKIDIVWRVSALADETGEDVEHRIFFIDYCNPVLPNTTSCYYVIMEAVFSTTRFLGFS